MNNYQKPTAEVVELLSAQEIAVNTGTSTRPGTGSQGSN